MSDIIKAQSAESICAHRDNALRLLSQGLVALAQAEAEYALATTGGEPNGARHLWEKGLASWDRCDLIGITEDNLEPLVEKYRVALDGAAWTFLRDITGLRNLMDSTAIDEFNEKIRKNPPALTIENIQATFEQASETSTDIFERGVLEVFNKIRRSAKKYRTSDPGLIGERFIMESMLDAYGCGLSYYGDSRSVMNDIERIFFVVQHRPPPDHLAGLGAKVDAHAREYGNSGIVKSADMELKLCKNGNIHVHITNSEALRLVNRIIAKHYGAVLPDDRNRPARER